MLRSLFSKLAGTQSDSFPIAYRGQRFVVPRRSENDYILQRMEKTKKFYEPELLRALQRVVPKSGIALDCGANVGNHALFFSGVLDLKVHAFEPVPSNIALLQKLVELNGLEQQIVVAETALGDAVGEVSLGLPAADNPGMYSVIDGASDVVAPVITLDAYMDQNGIAPSDVALIKIDVEGYEIPVIRGAQHLLNQGDACLCVEVFGAEPFEEMVEILSPYGYHPRSVHCHTPTVIFAKGQQDIDAVDRVRAVQKAFDERNIS